MKIQLILFVQIRISKIQLAKGQIRSYLPIAMVPNIRNLNHLITDFKTFGNEMAFGLPSSVFNPLQYLSFK